jgi:protein-S-isoprenylcysteine O-methyltransferase Ste14
MLNTDLLIYVAHLGFWASFGITRMLTRASPEDVAAPEDVAQQETTAPFSRIVLGFHMLAFGLMYFGVGNAVIPDRVPSWFAGQRVLGVLVMALGAALMSWAVAFFHSWRFRAKLDQGHQLATEGPFRLLRHPIYMGLNLLALGTAIWVPTAPVWTAFVMMAVGSDLRARSEEALMRRAFGAAYTQYCARTRRFVPGLY